MKFRLEDIGNIKMQIILFLLAIVVRIFFLHFATPFYFGESGIQVLGDTWWWVSAVENLAKFGIYSSDLSMPNGYFYRPPGYAIILLPLFLIFENWTSVFEVLIPIQIILDSFTAVIFFKITWLLTQNAKASLLSGLLYVFYIFSFGWTAVTYPETLSIFFLAAGIYYSARIIASKESYLNYFLVGACLGLAALLRIQLLLIVPIPFMIIAYMYWPKVSQSILKKLAVGVLGILLTYGLWPLRNVVIQGELVLTQRLDDAGPWASDYMSFRSFIWSIKGDIEPEFTVLLADEKMDWPTDAKMSQHEVALADSAISLMRACGSATQHWKKTRGFGETVSSFDSNCNNSIQTIWTKLEENQKKNNALNFYLFVPLQNLKKAFFKNEFVSQDSNIVANVAFFLRSILLILGLGAGLILTFTRASNYKPFIMIILLIFISQYVFFCFYFRSIEMRYFMQTDSVLLLLIALGVSKYMRKR